MANKDLMKAALHEFKRSAEITRDVRFQANLRLNKRQRMSSYMIALLSLYVIGLSLIPNIFSLTPSQAQILLASSIILSVFVVLTSLIDGAQNFYHQGELLHQCARKVASVCHELITIDFDGNIDEAEKKFQSLQEKYRSALDECPINHENVDYYREQASKPHLFPKIYQDCAHLFFKRYSRFIYSFLLSYSWMFLHAVAILSITYIVIVFVLIPAQSCVNLSSTQPTVSQDLNSDGLANQQKQ